MASKRRIIITVETDSVLLVRQRKTATRVWCEKCGEFTEPATFEETMALIPSDVGAIAELIEAGKLHLIKGLNQSLLVCLLSVMRRAHKA